MKYIIDTSVILDDLNNLISISQNNNNKLYIPDIVLQEIDAKKTTPKDIGYQARKFNKMLDEAVIKKHWSDSQMTLNKVEANLNGVPITLYTVFMNAKNNYADIDIKIVNDQKIIDTAKLIKKSIIISRDLGLRNRAIASGVKAEAVKKEKVKALPNAELIRQFSIDLIQDQEEWDLSDIGVDKLPNFTNIELVDKITGRVVLAFYKNGKIRKIDEKKNNRCLNIEPQNKEQRFFLNLLLDPDVPIVIAAGVSGSGKNLLALAAAVKCQMEGGIKYCRNTVVAGDEQSQIGFLKGDEDQKLSKFTYPLMDSIATFIEIQTNKQKNSKEPIKILTEKDFIEENNISTININQMRGANLKGFLIFDEWQNSPLSINKLMMSRIKDISKLVILGDVNQIDHPFLNKYNNALSVMLKFAAEHDIVAGIKLKKVLRGKIAQFADDNL